MSVNDTFKNENMEGIAVIGMAAVSWSQKY